MSVLRLLDWRTYMYRGIVACYVEQTAGVCGHFSYDVIDNLESAVRVRVQKDNVFWALVIYNWIMERINYTYSYSNVGASAVCQCANVSSWPLQS